MQKHEIRTVAGIRARGIVAAVLAAVVSACGNSAPVGGGGGGGAPVPGAVLGKYDLYNQCWVMRADGAYVVRNGDAFFATGEDADEAERFYMRAANLARYLFYTPDEQLMTASGTTVGLVALADAEDGSDWTFDESGDALTAGTLGSFLAVDTADGNRLVMGASASALHFEPATGCAEFPEMPLGVIGQTYKGKLGEPVIGFAEVHAHMAMGMEMSDGSRKVGPSAGGVQYGHAVNRFGVTHALDDCEAMHGPDGSADPESLILDQTPGRTHDTQGWPTFVDWPFSDSQLHQQMYWRWVERAWMAGLRVMTVLGTNIEALCEVAQNSGGDRDADLGDVDCVDMSVGVKQVEYLYDMQDYIDAQFGGPGKGFFRIVKDPAEARQVIADGKLAVVPGLEFSNLFGCNVTFNPDGTEVRHCSREIIDAEIERVWDLGVRQVFPYHDVDSALGGTGIFSATLNLINYAGTNQFWKTYTCEDGGEGEKFFYDAGAEMPALPFAGSDPISQALIDNAQGQAPVYPPGRQCNARDITDLGIYAIDKIMKKGFVFDIDHAEIRSKQIMLDYAATMNPPYPMISGHGGHGGLSNAQAQQLIAQGGIIYPANKNGFDHVEFLNKLRVQWEASGTSRPLSMGYGADANGLRNLPGPRGMARIMETGPVNYPFQLFAGEDWGPQFAGIAPITVERLEIPLPGGRIWDLNEGGMYHYGMIADLVEEIRLEGGREALDTFYSSAETYLRLWEQTLAAAADARTKPTPDDVPR